MKRYSLTETAKLIRKALKEAFPQTVFSVRSKSYAGGCSITAHWTDGPRGIDVDPILKKFEGAGFDGMTDCKYYNPHSEMNGEPCEFATDFVFGSRSISAVLLQIAAYRVHRETKLPLLEVKDGAYPSLKDGFSMLVPFHYFPSTHPGLSTPGKGCIATDSNGRGEYYDQLVYQFARDMVIEAKAAEPTLPAMVTDTYIASTVKELIEGGSN